MRPWWIKAAIQGSLSRLPSSSRLNRALLQRLSGSLSLGEEQVREKWLLTQRHVDSWRMAVEARGPFTALEVGTGWHPVAPLALLASGASRVTTVDRESLLDRETTRAALLAAARGMESGSLPSFVGGLAERFRLASVAATTPVAMLRAAGVDVVIGDLRALGLPAGSVDLSVTNNTLEHIPEVQLAPLLDELDRLTSEMGASCHFIDLADHYANFDHRISPFHFLRFSSRSWRLFNNDLQHQNRLRASDYRRIFAEHGLPVVDETTDAGDERELPRHLAQEFLPYDTGDLLVHSMWVVCRPARVLGGVALV